MSHEAPLDLRIQRTHKFLQEAMIELIAEKGFDAITVGDIAERAMINRATFYRHYQDKYDLVARIFEETTSRLVENKQSFSKELDPNLMENPPEIWVRLFEHVAEYSRLYRAMLGKNGSVWFADRMREHIIKLFLEQRRLWEKQWKPGHQLNAIMPPELPVTQLSHVLIGTIVWWLESEKSYTPKQMAALFHLSAFFGYLAALGYEAPKPGKA